MGRENFYVIISRARHGTVLYVATHDLASLDEDEHVDGVKFDPDAYAAREILEQVVARETAELSATEQIRASLAEAESLSSLAPRYDHALDVATDAHYRQMVHQILPDLAEEVTSDSAWQAVRHALRDADAAGWDVPVLLNRTVRNRELATADSLAQVISWRLRRVLDTESVSVHSGADEIRYRSILTELAPHLAPALGPVISPITPVAHSPVGVNHEPQYELALLRALGVARMKQAARTSHGRHYCLPYGAPTASGSALPRRSKP